MDTIGTVQTDTFEANIAKAKAWKSKLEFLGDEVIELDIGKRERDGITLKRWDTKSKSVVIPGFISAVADRALNRNWAVNQCVSEVIIEEGVRSIGRGCFPASTEIVSIPSTVPFIGTDTFRTFRNGAEFKKITIGSRAVYLEQCLTDIEGLLEFNTPKGIARLDSNAFYSVSWIDKVNVRGSVLKNRAIEFCTINKLIIDDNTKMEDGAIENCTLKHIIKVGKHNSLVEGILRKNVYFKVQLVDDYKELNE